MPAEPTTAAVTCEDAAEMFPAMVDRSGSVAPEVWAHADSCLRCQAELARYRHLLRSLRALRNERVRPAPGSLRATVGAVEAAQVARSARRVAHVAYVGGAVVATAASAAGMLVWASRRREALAS
jgi:hypothetical protein